MKRLNKQVSKALLLVENGRLPEAREVLAKILQSHPEDSESLHLLGIVELQEGRAAQAEPLFRKAISINSRVAAYYINLGNCLRNLGETYEALIHFKKALSLQPRNQLAVSSAAILYAEQGLFADALPLFRKCVKSEPKNVIHKVNLAKAMRESEDIDGALGMAKRAVEQERNSPQAHNELGLVHKVLGEMDSAASDFLKAIELSPSYAQAYTNLSSCRRWTKADSGLLHDLEEILEDSGLSSRESSDIHFGLGKMYDDIGEWKKAFAHYEQANRQRQVVFDRAGFSRYVDQIIQNFDSAFFKTVEGMASCQDSPVFVFGMPRSGTTLVEQVLSSSDQATGIGEKHYIPDMSLNMATDLGVSMEYPACLYALKPDVIDGYANAYLDKVAGVVGEGVRSVDKMTSNFLHLGFIYSIFPKAKLVHCRRNPIDTGLSCFFQNFSGRVDFSYSLSDIAFYYKQYRRLMSHWNAVLPVAMHEVNYEDFVGHQEQQTRDLLSFCELEWNDAFLKPQLSKRAVYTASNWQVRQSVYSSSAGRWKHYEPYIRSFLSDLDGSVVKSRDVVNIRGIFKSILRLVGLNDAEWRVSRD